MQLDALKENTKMTPTFIFKTESIHRIIKND